MYRLATRSAPLAVILASLASVVSIARSQSPDPASAPSQNLARLNVNGRSIALSQSDSRLPAADSPFGLVLRIGAAYASRNLGAFSQALAQNYRFQFAEAELAARYPGGFLRDDEIQSADHLFHGFTGSDGIERPAARSIELTLDSLYVAPDPAHPDSSEVYQIVVVPRTSLRIELESDGLLEVPPRLHVFRCVRGDAAVLDESQSATAEDWYVCAWEEWGEATELLPDAVKIKNVAAGASDRLTVRALQNPARRFITVMLSLARPEGATLDLLDVMGRRIRRTPIGALGSGAHRVELQGGQPLRAGVYWLRLTQGETAAVSKVVMID